MIEKILSKIEEIVDEYKGSCVDNAYQRGSSDGAKWMKKKAIEIVQEVAKDGGNGWIPCSEKEPCKDGYYFITTSDGEVDAREYDYGNGWGWDGFERVIAWQPLPTPYRKGE